MVKRSAGEEPIAAAVARYESWVAGRMPLVADDLALKHERMAADPFQFLRATHFRWVQRFAEVHPELADAPRGVGVGDLHVENFGTWRDGEGRLVWGVNDFDEAARLPYTHDLVRLATSITLGRRVHPAAFGGVKAERLILDGYRRGLQRGGSPLVLAEERTKLAELIATRARKPGAFWKNRPPPRRGARGTRLPLAGAPALPSHARSGRHPRRGAA